MRARNLWAVLFASFSIAVARAEQTDEQRKLAYQMQEAILKTQSIERVKELLKAGVDVNAPIGCGTYSPMDGAVQTRNVEMVKFLLAHGAKALSRHLCDAAFANNPTDSLEMTRLLLKAGVDPNAPGDDIPPLTGAAFREHEEVVILLLAQPGINIERADVDGYTALMWAVRHGSVELAQLLLKAGANPEFTSKPGMSAANIANEEIGKQQRILQMLATASKSRRTSSR